MWTKRIILIFVVLIVQNAAFAAIVLLKNGNLIKGTIIEETEERIKIKSSIAVFELQKDDIEDIERGVAQYGGDLSGEWIERKRRLAKETGEARQELVRLQQVDADNRRLWQGFVEASLKEFDALYQRLGVSFDVTLGESFYNDRLQPLVDALSDKGIAVRSDGALAVFMEEEDMPPFLIQKSDGGFNYGTTDIATILYRMEKWRPEKIIYVTDERQQLHFRQLFTVAKRMGSVCWTLRPFNTNDKESRSYQVREPL